MRLSPESEPRHVAKRPPEWDGLVTTVTDLTQEDGGVFTETSARLMLGVVVGLDNEMLEENRYYGIGRVACEIARTLHEPKRREAFIDSEAQNITKAHDLHCVEADARRGVNIGARPYEGMERLRVSEIKIPGYIFQQGRSQEARNGLLALPASEAKLINTLIEAAVIKKDTAENIGKPKEITDFRVRKLVRGDQVDRQIGENLLSASYIFVQRSVEYEIAHRQGLDVEELLLQDPYIFDALSESDFRGISTTTAALVAAGVRNDEFADVVDKLEYTPDDSTLHTPREILRQPPAPVKFNAGLTGDLQSSLHAVRLRCPALRVTGMIPNIIGMVQDIVVVADQKITKEFSKSSRRY
jgi:hypothetical protein